MRNANSSFDTRTVHPYVIRQLKQDRLHGIKSEWSSAKIYRDEKTNVIAVFKVKSR